MSIRTKILIPMVAMAFVCALTIGLLAIYVVTAFSTDFNHEQLDNAKNLASTILEQYHDDAERNASTAAKNEQLVESLMGYWAGDDRQTLVTASVALLNASGVDFLTVMDAEGNVLVRAHEPDNFGDSLANQANVKNAMSGKQYTTTEKGSAVKMSVRSGVPIYDPENRIIGVVSLGYRLDQSEFPDHIAKMTGTEVTVFLGDTRVSTTIKNEKGERAIDTKASETVSKLVLSGQEYQGKADVLGKQLLTYYVPIYDVEGAVLGMLFVGLDTSDWDNRITQDIWLMVGSLVILAGISVVIARSVSGRVSGPIREVAEAARRMAAGDVDIELNIAKTGKSSRDETEKLKLAFMETVYANRERADIITEVARGDLSGTIEPKSDKDVVGIALKALLDKNNLDFSEMNTFARQLDSASSQIADGAQELSQAAVQQTSSVERIHLTLKQLSDKTTEKTTQAKQAAEMSVTVKACAEKGSRQMSQMMDAVGQISRASEDIGKVIKVIDDIAFQTNILALNAAVEAARAGQYGRGFAVVAEEVRNLAAKSAEAAKDTSALIANSIETAKLGAKISQDTASSFAEIVSGVNDSNVIVEEIAGFMQSQKNELEGVTSGVNEIGSIVTSVSSAAEQNAASSEEMSSQAAMMAATLASYRLRESSSRLEGSSGTNRQYLR